MIGPWMLEDGTDLRALGAGDAPVLASVIARDRGDFDRWLRWSASIVDEESARAFIDAATARASRGEGFHLGLRRGGTLVGGVVGWSLDRVHQVAELGYWAVPEARGRGMITKALAQVVAALFAGHPVNRIEFQCRVENTPSRRVAERVGAKLEGIRRQSHLVGGAFRDHAVYALLAAEWVPPVG